MSRKKVWVLGGYAPSLVNFRGPLLKALVAAGHEVIAGAAEDDVVVRDTLAGWGIRYDHHPISRTGLNPFTDWRCYSALRAYAKKERPDVLIAYTHKPVTYGAFSCRSSTRSYAIITGLGYAFTEGGGFKKTLARLVLFLLYRIASPMLSGVIFQNPDDLAVFRESGLIPPSLPSIVVRGSGVDLDRYSPLPVPSGVPRFLLIARLLGDKGVREYADAARLVKRDYPSARFHLVGPFDSNPAAIARSEVDAWVAEGLLEYHGEISDVRPYIAQASVYVLPSYREGTPRTVLEAMSIGRAVITTDAPGCRETIFSAEASGAERTRMGENGFLVPVRDVHSLASAMRMLIEQPSLVESMGRRARELAMLHYDVRKVNSTMLEFIGLDRSLDT